MRQPRALRTGPSIRLTPRLAKCHYCDGDGWIMVAYGGNPGKLGRKDCAQCHGRGKATPQRQVTL